MINCKSIALSCALGLGAMGIAGADDDNDAAAENASAAESEESVAQSAEAQVEEEDVIWLKEKDLKGETDQPYCIEFRPTGSRIKQRRCISAKQREIEKEAGKKYLEHYQDPAR